MFGKRDKGGRKGEQKKRQTERQGEGDSDEEGERERDRQTDRWRVMELEVVNPTDQLNCIKPLMMLSQ